MSARQLLLVLIMLAAVLAAGTARAQEQVRFPPAASPPTALQKRMAAMRGEDAKGTPGLMLQGHLRRPRRGNGGDGPFAALVLLYSCQGITGTVEDWADQLAAWGYLTLLVDSYGPRRHAPNCNSYEAIESVDQTFDAIGALKYLRQRKDVDSGQIGLIGWSIGGSKVLSALNQIGVQNLYPDKFAYGIAFYPNCLTASGPFIGPLLMLIGGQDDWTTAARCVSLRDANAGSVHPMDLQIFPDSFHFFDDPDMGPVRYRAEAENREKNPTRGVTWGYNPAARNAAQDTIRQFLERRLREN